MRSVWGCSVLILMVAAFYGTTHVAAEDKLLPVSLTWWNTGNILDLSLHLNICIEDLLAANPQIFGEKSRAQTFYSLLDTGRWWMIYWQEPIPLIFTPLHRPCYRILQGSSSAEAEVLENICHEEILFGHVQTDAGNDQVSNYYAWWDALPCINDQGERLEYAKNYDEYLTVPRYKNMPYGLPPADVCLGDLMADNPGLYAAFGPNRYRWARSMQWWPIEYQTMTQFIPLNARHCRTIEETSSTLYELSLDENVCMETILEASGLYLFNWKSSLNDIFIPIDAPACYDTQGKRIGHNDKAIHEINVTDSLLAIAQQYDVCFQDLWDANPALKRWTGWEWPEIKQLDVLFIPETPPCEQTVTTFKTQIRHTLYAVSLMTDVCVNRLIDANPQYPWLNTIAWGQDFSQELILIIPQRPSCYRKREKSAIYDEQRDRWTTRVCYTVPVTPESDFTGHIPPISVSDDPDLPYCEPLYDGIEVVYENERYWLNTWYGGAQYIWIEECFGVDPETLNNLNARSIPVDVRPMSRTLIPKTDQNCGMTYGKWSEERQLHLGKLDSRGIYTVANGDTLSSIGREFGYLPSMIAAENNLEMPSLIYPYQQLQMPHMPSLYDIGKALLYVGSVGAGMISFGMYRMRRSPMRKKKNS